MLTRQCPRCGHMLYKVDPMEPVYCLCGWCWL
jgi:hypothetical protein